MVYHLAACWRSLLNDLGGLEQHVRGDGEAEGVGGPEIDHEVEFTGLLDGEVGGLGAFKDTRST
jgi:hypothetical protein